MMKQWNRALLRARLGLKSSKRVSKYQGQLVDVLFDDSRPKTYTAGRRLLRHLKFLSCSVDADAKLQCRKPCQEEHDWQDRIQRHANLPRPVNGVMFGANDATNNSHKNAEERHH
jgi:hypothetical protein